jgi:hypothetical protein
MNNVKENWSNDLRAAKRVLCRSLSCADSSFYLEKEKQKTKKSFDHAFEYKLSTSLVIVGSSNDEAISLVRSVHDLYNTDSFGKNGTSQRHTKLKNYIARVNGSIQSTDHEALLDMTNQFLVRNEKEGNVNVALEELEDYFRQCRIDGIPGIIVLENFHSFAKRKRQTLIYTLLDLMHNKDLLFMVSELVVFCIYLHRFSWQSARYCFCL